MDDLNVIRRQQSAPQMPQHPQYQYRSQADRLPLELVVWCYESVFPPYYFTEAEGVVVEKPKWKDIQGLTLASKQSRELILSMWFRVLKLELAFEVEGSEELVEGRDMNDLKERVSRWTRYVFMKLCES